MALCGNAECFGDGTPALKLPVNRVLVFVRDALRDFDQDAIWSWVRVAYDRAAHACDINCTRIMDLNDAKPGQVVHLITVADLGTGGVLADQRLPYAGGAILPMRINTRIRWDPTDGAMKQGTIDPWRTLTHELGHFLGLSHFPVGSPAELMEPSISQTILGFQPTEARVLEGWYGRPVSKPPGADDGDEIVIRPSKKQVVAPGYTLVQV